MATDQEEVTGEVSEMKIVNLNRSQEIKPIEWQPYTGETIVVRTIIRGGKKVQETGYYEDRVKCVP